jgi:hypothetical protein
MAEQLCFMGLVFTFLTARVGIGKPKAGFDSADYVGVMALSLSPRFSWYWAALLPTVNQPAFI